MITFCERALFTFDCSRLGAKRKKPFSWIIFAGYTLQFAWAFGWLRRLGRILFFWFDSSALKKISNGSNGSHSSDKFEFSTLGRCQIEVLSRTWKSNLCGRFRCYLYVPSWMWKMSPNKLHISFSSPGWIVPEDSIKANSLNLIGCSGGKWNGKRSDTQSNWSLCSLWTL